MSNTGEGQKARSWIITLEKQDGTMAQRNVHSHGETLAKAVEMAESEGCDIWLAIAGRILR